MKKHRMKNIVLDGMPRTLDQAKSMAKALKSIYPVDAFFFIDAHEKEVKDRLRKRRQCPQCGKVFGKVVLPKRKGTCDRCGGKLKVRNDDKPSVIHERFLVYEKETVPVIDWASSRYPVFYIDGHGKPGVVFKRLVRLFPLLKG
jgi:adenylate kinase